MDVDPLPYLLNCREKLARLSRARRKNIILSFFILMLGVGLFFYSFKSEFAYAKVESNDRVKILPDMLDPINKIGEGVRMKEDVFRDRCEGQIVFKQEKEIVTPIIKKQGEAVKIDPSILNPISKVGEKIGMNADSKEKVKEDDSEISKMVSDSPMAAMIPALKKIDQDVAAYLVAIAKKESDWGRHTPKKNGKECYNFWGYRGKENATASGYSCFDSPDHAVEVVSNRIERLVNQGINTPSEMVIWKCGSDCNVTGGQAAANKWIADVSSVYNKLKS